jgi:hypothetical protein
MKLRRRLKGKEGVVDPDDFQNLALIRSSYEILRQESHRNLTLITQTLLVILLHFLDAVLKVKLTQFQSLSKTMRVQ